MEIIYYIRRAKELGRQEAWAQGKEILLGRVTARLKETYDRYLRKEVNDAKVLQLSGFSSREVLANHFRQRSQPAFFIDTAKLSRVAEFQRRYPEQAEALIRAADQIVRHHFDLLGSGLVNMDSSETRRYKVIRRDGTLGEIRLAASYLPWQTDIKSGVGWMPDTHYKRIRYGNLPGVDVKVPWELSRFQHLIILGQAYHLSGNERYAVEFCRQLDDWIDNNPCRFGVNWSCTMEVGIRAVNWIFGFYFFRQSPSLDDAFVLKFLTSLYNHAQFILENLEFRKAWVDGQQRRLNSNHYLGDLIGVLYITTLFPELKLSRHADWAAAELEKELLEETSDDGVDYEHSIPYHRLVCEIFVSGFLLLRVNGKPFSGAAANRLMRMAEFVADYSRPDRSAPQIGDNDNGRLHPLSLRNAADHTYLPFIVAEMFERADLRSAESDPEVWWWANDTEAKLVADRPSAAYPNAGFFVMRTTRLHVFVSAARVGMCGFGSHSHNDILSFEYWADGQPWIVDPGTYAYTADPAARNLFRSTAYHNGVRVDGREINTIRQDQLFQMADAAEITIHEWQTNEVCDILDAEHNGYAKADVGVLHRRRFQLDKLSRALHITDVFKGHGAHRLEWSLNLHPSVIPSVEGEKVLLRVLDARVIVKLPTVRGVCEIRPGWYSPSYGLKQPSLAVVFKSESELPFTTSMSIAPEADSDILKQ